MSTNLPFFICLILTIVAAGNGNYVIASIWGVGTLVIGTLCAFIPESGILSELSKPHYPMD